MMHCGGTPKARKEALVPGPGEAASTWGGQTPLEAVAKKCSAAFGLTNITSLLSARPTQAAVRCGSLARGTMSIKGKATASTPCSLRFFTQVLAWASGRVTSTRGDAPVQEGCMIQEATKEDK